MIDLACTFLVVRSGNLSLRLNLVYAPKTDLVPVLSDLFLPSFNTNLRIF